MSRPQFTLHDDLLAVYQKISAHNYVVPCTLTLKHLNISNGIAPASVCILCSLLGLPSEIQ